MRDPANTWPEAWVVEMLDLKDQGLKYADIAVALSKKYKVKITAPAVNGQMYRLRKGGFLR